jgi:hypothetical protein
MEFLMRSFIQNETQTLSSDPNEISDKICIRIFTGGCRDVHCQRRKIQMKRQKVREHYPHQWLLIEAIKARSEGGKRVLLLCGKLQ